jgi:sporulation protein YlmC with PRC-barrel domain
MPRNQFENSRISEGTYRRAAQHISESGSASVARQDSDTISRNDVRDGFSAPRVISAGTLSGDRVHNPAGEVLGIIEEIMIDIGTGRIAYAVLSFGGFLGIGDKLFAVPWSALRIDDGTREFILNLSREQLDNAPGFDKHDWPDMANPDFGNAIHSHYGEQPYWNQNR